MDPLTVVLFPYAGGSCSSFQFLTRHITDLKSVVVELPGRGKRGRAPLLCDFREAVEDLTQEVVRQVGDIPFLIYGHSMGAALGFEVARNCLDIGLPLHRLLVTGNSGPGSLGRVRRSELPADQFWAEVKKLGGVPEELFNNPSLMDYFLPILRCDFAILESEDASTVSPIELSITAIRGDCDPLTDQLGAWRNYSTREVQTSVLNGGHFFVHEHAQHLGQVIRSLAFRPI